MKPYVLCLLMLLIAEGAGAQMVTKEIIYNKDSLEFKGYAAFDEKVKGKRPGILVVHEWWGLNDFIKEKARELAAMGYVAFAPDMYGEGQTTIDPREAAKMAGGVRGTPRFRKRVVLGYAMLRSMASVDSQKTAAIGFCFGGTAVLELAYSGAGVKGVAAFHAGIPVPKQEDVNSIKAKLLVLHGADDPFTQPDSIRQFQELLRKSGVDWQMVCFGNAVHGFTNPSNGTDNKKGLAYNAFAARRSWKYMRDFLDEMFLTGPVSGHN